MSKYKPEITKNDDGTITFEHYGLNVLADSVTEASELALRDHGIDVNVDPRPPEPPVFEGETQHDEKSLALLNENTETQDE